MRAARLLVLLLIAFLITAIVRFPAAPIIDRFVRPQLGPVALEGVSGPLIGGTVARVRSTDDLLPLEVSDVHWSLAPLKLFSGAAANTDFSAYGGGGELVVTRAWNGDILLDDVMIAVDAKQLEPLLPVPLASFSGRLSADIASLRLVNNLLTRMDGKIVWTDAQLETPLSTDLGTLEIAVRPEGEQSHVATLSAGGGDLVVDGSVSIELDGNFSADIALTPSPTAPPELVGAISRVARPESGGRYRLQQSGNLNRLAQTGRL